MVLKRVLRPLMLWAVPMLAGAAPLAAQGSVDLTPIHRPYSTSGLFVNGHLNGSGVSFDEEAAESGGGAGIRLGYGFGRVVTLYAGATGAMVEDADADTYALAHVDLGLRLHVPTSSRVTPYLDASYTGIGMDYSDYDISAGGAGPSLGGGLLVFLASPLALDLGMKWTFGTLNEISLGGETAEVDVDANSARFDIGLSWFPTGS